MLVSTCWPYYSEMECKENYRRVMATCVRKVYDNDKIYYTPWLEPPWMLRPGTSAYQAYREIRQWAPGYYNMSV
jgi:hypothetical protein